MYVSMRERKRERERERERDRERERERERERDLPHFVHVRYEQGLCSIMSLMGERTYY